MPVSPRVQAVCTAVLLLLASGAALAKGSSGGSNPCNASPLACPLALPAGSGVQVDELVNNTFDAYTLGIAYATPAIASGERMHFLLSGPGNGANLLPFLATATLNVHGASGALLFSLAASNYDPTGQGSSAYLVPQGSSLGGVSLDERVTAFEGGIAFDAVNQSGAPVSLVLDLSIPATGYGQVTVTNTYTLAPVPEPMVAPGVATGVLLLAAARRMRGRAA